MARQWGAAGVASGRTGGDYGIAIAPGRECCLGFRCSVSRGKSRRVAPQEERNCIEGSLASEHMKELVGEGDALWLQYDTSVSDRYGRLLAYVWRNPPDSVEAADDPEVIARDMLNAIQVIDGYGQARTYRPDTYHDRLFAQWGAEALADARGVTAKWA